ncbi:MAG: 4-phosphoerythronate dehydrogenase [Bacteroidaceae bacterium]|nr:4-phosphoerythronate dehydrogenase [Bacteroidaceae bacterium]
MKIVMDEKIPYLAASLAAMGCDVVAKAGDDISAADVKDADALFVRTRTNCNASLLDGSAVRFIGTATIGYDHIDDAYCRSRGIYWTSAPACNAGGVLQYVQSSLYLWCRKCGRPLNELTLGIVGVGAIGSRVARWARAAGMRVLLNDPPREAAGETGFVSLAQIAAECDVVTFHPTLTRGGDYPSYHLAGEAFFDSLQRAPLFINASRGPVADNVALLAAYKKGKVADIVLDVWEGEPEINRELLDASFIATPHIAGYSAEGKLNASNIVLQKFAEFIDYKRDVPLAALSAPSQPVIEAVNEGEAFLAIYNPLLDTEPLKKSPLQFEELRNNYNFRREPTAYKIDIL